MAVFTVAAGVVNYASNIIFSRLLDPIGFGELTSLLALAVIIVVPAAAAQTVIAERVASHFAAGDHARVRYLVRHAAAHIGVIAVTVGVLFAIAVPVIVGALDLRQPGPAIALSAFLTLSFMQPVALGVLQGLQRFTALGAMQLSIAVSRVALGVPWVLAGGGAGGAIGGQAAGIAVVLLGTAVLLRNLVHERGAGAATAGLRRRPDVRTISASTAFIAFAVLSNLDLLLAKVFLEPVEVGEYAATATIGKMVLFLPAAAAVVLVPNAAELRDSPAERMALLRRAARIVAVIAVVSALPAAIVPGTVVNVMFGAAYAGAAAGVLPIVVAGACLSMLYLLVVYAVTISDRRWSVVLAVGVVVQVVGATLFHESPEQIAMVQATAALAALAINESWFHSIARPA